MHQGYSMAAAMWAITAVSLGFVGLRLYTRTRIVRYVGVEDYMYIFAGVLLIGFTASIQVSVYYGLGTSFWILSLDDSSNAILWTYISNSFAITANAMAKLSLGFFLLRVVQHSSQKTALWSLILVTAATSIALVIMLWNQTTPVKASWDPLRTPGTWNIQIKPMSVGLGAWSSICDFFFAIFPWLFIRGLRMPRREKITLASGMSLGVLAGACGIVRTVVLANLDIMDYTLNFNQYFAWAGAEIAVSMICLGLPTLRPLYLKGTGRSGYYSQRQTPREGDSELPQYASKPMKPTPPLPPVNNQPLKKEERPKTPNFFRGSTMSDMTSEMEPARGAQHTRRVSKPAVVHTRWHSDSDSAEGILGSSSDRRRGRNSGAKWNRTRASGDGERRLSNWPLRG